MYDFPPTSAIPREYPNHANLKFETICNDGGNHYDPDHISVLNHIHREDHITIERLVSTEIGLVEAKLPPGSHLIGKTLRQTWFRYSFDVIVLAIRRNVRAYHPGLRDMSIRFGDALLLYGQRTRLRMSGREPDFLVLAEKAQETP